MEKQDIINYELIAKALFERYETIYDIDMETNVYSTFYESEAYRRLMIDTEGKDFFKVLPEKVKQVIADEDQKYVVRMLQKENLIKGLENEKYYSLIYRIKQEDKEVYHLIRATYQPVNGRMHVFMGVRNIDSMMRREESHRKEIQALYQKEMNHMQAVLASAAAYMEANLTQNILLEKSNDGLETEKQFIKRIPSIEDIPEYDIMHSWICDNLVTENRKEYRRCASREYLMECFERGELRSSVLFSVYTKEGGIQPCREIFFLYQEKTTKDIHAFCVIYDLTEQQKKEGERKLLENELKMSRIRNFTSQMQPHFLYNALGSIQEVILMDPEYAAELLGNFTVHLRSCIRSMTKDEPLPVDQEMENVKAYIEIEKMRFGDKLRAHYEVGTNQFSILPLTIQPIVENSIRHGIYEKGKAGGDVYIRTKSTEDAWVVEVEDNGIGFDVDEYMARQRTGQGDSTGLENIRFRLEKVMNAHLQVKSTKGIGTVVTLTIPKTYEQAYE